MMYVADRQTGTFIQRVDSVEAGRTLINEYEEADRNDGTFEEDFYDIVDENHCSV